MYFTSFCFISLVQYNLEEEYADIQTHTIPDDILIERENIREEAEKLRQKRAQTQANVEQDVVLDDDWGMKNGEVWVNEDVGADGDSDSADEAIEADFGYTTCDGEPNVTDSSTQRDKDTKEEKTSSTHKIPKLKLKQEKKQPPTAFASVQPLDLKLDGVNNVNPDLRDQDLAHLLKEMLKML